MFSFCKVRLELLRKINTSGGTENDRRTISAKVENYRRDARICRDEFTILFAPAIQKAVMDSEALGIPLPPTFPRRGLSDDIVDNITPFTDKPPSDEVPQENRKRKSLSRAQQALQALAAELEEPAVLLPSAYHKVIREHVGMKVAVETETRLREGLAMEGLDRLRLHLTTYKALQLRKSQVSGVINNTDIDRRIDEKRIATDRAKYQYRKNRYLLRILGMHENHAKFKPLLDRDCYAFVITAAESRLGDSHRLPSWIWGDFGYIVKVKDGDIRNFLDDSEYAMCWKVWAATQRGHAGLKAHWFRHSALVRRWEEAVHTRREEMYRTLRSYHADKQKWLDRAGQHDTAGRLGAGSFARRYADA